MRQIPFVPAVMCALAQIHSEHNPVALRAAVMVGEGSRVAKRKDLEAGQTFLSRRPEEEQRTLAAQMTAEAEMI